MSILVKKQHVILAGKFKCGWNQYKNVTFKKTQPLQRVRPRSDGFANLLIRRLRNPILFRLNPMILTSTLFADFIPLGMARLLASEFFQFFIFFIFQVPDLDIILQQCYQLLIWICGYRAWKWFHFTFCGKRKICEWQFSLFFLILSENSIFCVYEFTDPTLINTLHYAPETFKMWS